MTRRNGFLTIVCLLQVLVAGCAEPSVNSNELLGSITGGSSKAIPIVLPDNMVRVTNKAVLKEINRKSRMRGFFLDGVFFDQEQVDYVKNLAPGLFRRALKGSYGPGGVVLIQRFNATGANSSDFRKVVEAAEGSFDELFTQISSAKSGGGWEKRNYRLSLGRATVKDSYYKDGKDVRADFGYVMGLVHQKSFIYFVQILKLVESPADEVWVTQTVEDIFARYIN